MAQSDIVVTPVEGKSDLKAFIDLPKRLFAGHKGYTPHLNVERQEAFSPKKNPLFKHVEVQFFLARRAGRVVGRISAQVDRVYLARYADDTGHFGCLAAEDDPAIFDALFKAAEDWLRAKGMKRATGPFSLSAAAFRQDFSNFQLNTFDGTVFIVENVNGCSSSLGGGDRDQSKFTAAPNYNAAAATTGATLVIGADGV